MTAKIQGVENVASLSLVTKEDALDYMRDAFGEDQSVLDGLEEDNPFRTSYNVTLKDITQAADTAAQLRKIEGVAEVNNKQELLDKIVYITDIIRTASVWVMILLCIGVRLYHCKHHQAGCVCKKKRNRYYEIWSARRTGLSAGRLSSRVS